MKYLILGSSAAGLFAAEAIRRQVLQSEITVLTADTQPSYSRCLTTYYLSGEVTEEQLFLRTPEELNALGLDIHYSCEVNKLDPKRRLVFAGAGEAFPYDKCLIATGASAITLDIPGASLPEVFTLRCLEDAQRMKPLLRPGRRAVIIGGGLVSLKAAYALHKQGLEVHVIVSSGHILSQMLNSEAASILAEHLQKHGMNLELHSDVLGIGGEKKVESVQLRDGRTLPADLVIVGKGVSPNTAPFLGSGLAVNKGILVNEYLETNLADVYAAGDVAETWDSVRQTQRINAIWPNATQQGHIAGLNMTGQHLTYPGSISMNAVDFFGLRIVSAGIIHPLTEEMKQDDGQRADGWSCEERCRRQPGELPSYQRLIWQGNILKGYVLIGSPERAGILTALIQTQRSLSPTDQKSIRDGKQVEIILKKDSKIRLG